MIRDQLPKIGTEVDGQVHLGDDENTYAYAVRPNYHEIKKQKYNSEEALVGVLLGLALPSVISSVCIEKMNHIKRKDDVIFTLDQQYKYFFELLTIIKEIRKALDIGIAAGEIKKIDLEPRTEGIPTDPRSICIVKIKNTCHFSKTIYFDNAEFFIWMEQRGFHGPKDPGQKNDPLGDVVGYLLATEQGKIKDSDVIQLLESKNIRFNYPNMPKDEKRKMVKDLRGKGLDKRMIALILDWQRIKSKQVKLDSTKRRLYK